MSAAAGHCPASARALPIEQQAATEGCFCAAIRTAIFSETMAMPAPRLPRPVAPGPVHIPRGSAVIPRCSLFLPSQNRVDDCRSNRRFVLFFAEQHAVDAPGRCLEFCAAGAMQPELVAVQFCAHSSRM